MFSKLVLLLLWSSYTNYHTQYMYRTKESPNVYHCVFWPLNLSQGIKIHNYVLVVLLPMYIWSFRTGFIKNENIDGK